MAGDLNLTVIISQVWSSVLPTTMLGTVVGSGGASSGFYHLLGIDQAGTGGSKGTLGYIIIIHTSLLDNFSANDGGSELAES